MQKLSLRTRLAAIFVGFDRPLALIVFALVGTGLLTLYSAGLELPGTFESQLRNFVVAFVLMWLVTNVSQQTLMKVAVPLYSVAVALLVAVAMFGLVKKGARRWLNVGVVVQPSELMKIAMPLMLAWFFDKRDGMIGVRDYLVAGLLLLIPVGLIARQPDLGTALLVLAAGLYVIYLAGLSWRLIVPVLAVAVIGILLLAIFGDAACLSDAPWPLLKDYQKHRICTLIDPTTDPLGKGFHTIQAMIAIGSGGFFGKGWLHGTQTHLEFIPEKHTDFIFAVYSEEFGLLGNLVLLVLFGLLIARGLAIASRASTLFARLLAGSVTMIFFTYALVNMGMVSGILPVVGVPLPFISYGGTALATLGFGVGILMNIARGQHLVQS